MTPPEERDQQDEHAMSRPSTLASPPAVSPVRPDDRPPEGPSSTGRYTLGKLLGVGGMGEVVLCRDDRLGRTVAMKIIDERRLEVPGRRRRFVNEARIQGQLQHPSIVPVYDLDRNDRGVDYFTMKRISGNTLELVVQLLGHGDTETRTRFPLRRRLALFRRLCQCMEYAHAARVVHRDLKPGNVMIGDYGEVYVLDWGVAKLLDGASPPEGASGEAAMERTGHGQILGTPGYMAPEQSLDSQGVDARADIYALGAILFELLTLEPLHRGHGTRILLHSTRAGADARASERAPHRDIAPELDVICVRATALEPAQRFASVRELREALDAYLEGERDVDLRRQLAARHAASAQTLAAHARESRSARHRAQALKEAGRALGLDPTCAPAQQLLIELLLQPDERGQSLALAAQEREALAETRDAAQLAAFAYGGFLSLLPLLVWVGIRSWSAVVLVFVPLLAAFALAVWRGRMPSANPRLGLSMYLMGSLAIAASSGIAGPLVLTPALAAAHTLAFGNTSSLREFRTLVLAGGCATVLVPALLEWSGWLPHMYRFEAGNIVIPAGMVEMAPVGAPALLFLVSVFTVVVPLLVVFRLGDDLEDKRQQLHEYLWNLGQLWPGGQELSRGRTDGEASSRTTARLRHDRAVCAHAAHPHPAAPLPRRPPRDASTPGR
jgi:eukaryotic-like serine/threonine-protein kinase